MFFIPDGVDEIFYNDDPDFDVNLIDAQEDAEDVDGVEITDSGSTGGGGGTSSPPTPTPTTDKPDTPMIYGIVSQTIRQTKAGNEVVDVIFNIETIAGFTKYELRLSKI